MPTRTANPQRPRRGPLRSPLAAAPHSPLPPPRPAAGTERAATQAVPEPRPLTLALLNRYFRRYFHSHGQGGTHTQQRNLIQLFNFLRREYSHPAPTPMS